MLVKMQPALNVVIKNLQKTKIMATYRIIKRRLRFDNKETYHVERKVLCFWLDILNNSFFLGTDAVANYKGWFCSKEEAKAVIDKLMEPKKKRNEVVWTNETRFPKIRRP